MSVDILHRYTRAVLHTVAKDTLRGANLRDADLRGANLRDANLSGANLSDADLSDADLRGADLSGADLSGANLRDADLRDADLRDADLSCANLRDANLRDASMYERGYRAAITEVVARLETAARRNVDDGQRLEIETLVMTISALMWCDYDPKRPRCNTCRHVEPRALKFMSCPCAFVHGHASAKPAACARCGGNARYLYDGLCTECKGGA